MTIEEIRAFSIEEVEARASEIEAMTNEEGADIEALSAEMDALTERKRALKAEAEERAKKEAEAVEAREVVETFEELEEKREMFGIETKEYRDAFYAVLTGNATEEQRAITVDGTTGSNGDAIAIPKSLDEKIWDGIHTAHPILADIATVNSGVVLEVTKHTAIATRTTKKNDGAATPAEENNTFVKVALAGKDYEKWVELSYAAAKMSQGALEDYLAEEIAAELGEALAKDVFAQIISDAGASQKVTPSSDSPDLFGDIKKALALAVGANAPVIYAPASKYYEIVGAIAQGSPFNMAAALGMQVKLDNAATKVTVVDPKSFVLNQVQGVLVESDKDVKAHKIIVSGYLRAEGTLRRNNAAAYIN